MGCVRSTAALIYTMHNGKGFLRMFKKISAFLIAAALIGGVTSCQMPDAIFPDSAFETEEKHTEVDAISIYGFDFNLSGVKYELPIKYSALSARGWKLAGDKSDEADDGASDLPVGDAGNNGNADNDGAQTDEDGVLYTADTLIQPEEYSDYVTIERNGESIALKFYNDGKKAQTLENCLVVGVMVEADSDEPSDFTLDGDVTLGMTYEKIVTTYGRPSYTKDVVKSSGELAAINDIAFIDGYDEESDDLTRTLCYSISDTSVVSFELGEYEGKSDSVVRIEMDNVDPVEEKYDYSKDLKKRSSVITLYKAPNLLGKTFDDFAFKYESNLYTLPIPIQKLIDDGWVFVRGAGQDIPKGVTQDGVVMRKGNLAMSILVHNYDLKRSQTPVNCYAVSLSASVVGPNVKILMPKGVTLGSEYSELVTAFGDEYAMLSGYVDKTEQTEDDKQPAESNEEQQADDETKAAFEQQPVGTVEIYELTEEEGCVIVKTVEEGYTVYSYIMPDDVPTITLPVSITDIKDPNSDLLGEHRKRIDVYISNVNGRVVKIDLQNCPEYLVNESEILQQQMEAAEKAAQEQAAQGEQDQTGNAAAESSSAQEQPKTQSKESVETDGANNAGPSGGADKADKIGQSNPTAKNSAENKKSSAVIAKRLEILSALNNRRPFGAD